jgi:hypothetical protein
MQYFLNVKTRQPLHYQMEGPANNLRNSSSISPVPVRDLFDGTGPNFSAAEIEFMAENCLVTIKPKRKMEEIDLISVIKRECNFSNIGFRVNLGLLDRIRLKMFRFGWLWSSVKETTAKLSHLLGLTRVPSRVLCSSFK